MNQQHHQRPSTAHTDLLFLIIFIRAHVHFGQIQTIEAKSPSKAISFREYA